MRKFLWFLSFIVLVVLLAGVYKFNFTDDDIYMQNSQGEWVQHDKLNTQE